MIVADTNVVSELMKDEPALSVLEWAGSLGAAEVTITVVTVEEIHRGIGRLPVGRRQATLATRWAALLASYAESILVHDVESARRAAEVLVARQRAGRPMGLADAQIAGICVAHGRRLATRNVDDFAGIADLEVIDPFA